MTDLKPITMEEWDRKATFDFFMQYDIPQYNVTTHLDVTAMAQLWDQGLSKFKSILFLVCLLKSSYVTCYNISDLFRRKFSQFLNEFLILFKALHYTNDIKLELWLFY